MNLSPNPVGVYVCVYDGSAISFLLEGCVWLHTVEARVIHA